MNDYERWRRSGAFGAAAGAAQRPRSRREVLEAMAAVLALAACGGKTGDGGGSGSADAAGNASDGAISDSNASGTDAAGTTDSINDTEADATPNADAIADAAVDTKADAAADAAADIAADTNPGLPTAADFLTPITKNEYYFVTSCCSTPDVDAATWKFEIYDRGTLLGSVDMAMLDSLAAETKEHTLECISAYENAQKVGNAVWTGLPLTTVLAAANIAVPTGVDTIVCTGADGYTTGLHLADLALPIWLVWRMNGEPLPKTHGFPARMLVPGRYGMKSPKWLTRIEFVKGAFLGFWELQGWSDEAIIPPHVFVRYPEGFDKIAPGPVRIGGSAFAGSDPVSKVEVRLNGGDWQPAVLNYDASSGDNVDPKAAATGAKADVWTLWYVDTVAVAGTLNIETRCTTLSGKTTAGDGTASLAGYAGGMKQGWKVG